MGFLVAGLVLVAVVAGVNFVFTIGLVGRLRDLQDTLRALTPAPPAIALEPGDPLPDFAGTARDGSSVRRADVLGSEVLFGFFSPDCSACVDAVPTFTAHARELSAAGGRTVAVVVGDGAHTSEVATKLAGVADILVTEDQQIPLSGAFEMVTYPVFVTADAAGTVTSAGVGVAALPRAGVTA